MGLSCKKNIGRQAGTFDRLDKRLHDVKKKAHELHEKEERKKK